MAKMCFIIAKNPNFVGVRSHKTPEGKAIEARFVQGKAGPVPEADAKILVKAWGDGYALQAIDEPGLFDETVTVRLTEPYGQYKSTEKDYDMPKDVAEKLIAEGKAVKVAQ